MDSLDNLNPAACGGSIKKLMIYSIHARQIPYHLWATLEKIPNIKLLDASALTLTVNAPEDAVKEALKNMPEFEVAELMRTSAR